MLGELGTEKEDQIRKIKRGIKEQKMETRNQEQKLKNQERNS